MLKRRRSDLPVPVPRRELPDQRLQPLPLRRLVGKDIVNAAGRFHNRSLTFAGRRFPSPHFRDGNLLPAVPPWFWRQPALTLVTGASGPADSSTSRHGLSVCASILADVFGQATQECPSAATRRGFAAQPLSLRGRGSLLLSVIARSTELYGSLVATVKIPSAPVQRARKPPEVGKL